MPTCFPVDLPLLEKLYLRNGLKAGVSFFSSLPKRLRASQATLAYYQEIENCLTFIPARSWEQFARRIDESDDLRTETRFWEKLHDVLNEARGARALVRRYGCIELEMLTPSNGRRSPDWKGLTSDGSLHYAEVKTINHSNEEQELWSGAKAQARLLPVLGEAFIRKLRSTYQKACAQLSAAPNSSQAVKVVVLAVNVDHNVASADKSVEQLVNNAVMGIVCADYPIHAEICSA